MLNAILGWSTVLLVGKVSAIDVERKPAPRALTVPPKILAAVAGQGLAGLVPDRVPRAAPRRAGPAAAYGRRGGISRSFCRGQ